MHHRAADQDDALCRLLVKSVTDYAIYMLDPDGVVMSWNAGAERLKGYGAEDIIGRNFSLFYTEEDWYAGLTRKALAAARATGTFAGEGWRVRRDGSRFWASVVIHAIRDEADGLVGFAKVTRDLTDRKRQDDACRSLAANLDLALTNMSQGLVLFDAEERLVLCNARWRDLLGLDETGTRPGTSLTELLRRLLSSAEPGIDDEALSLLAGRQRARHLATLERADGTVTEEAVFHGRILGLSHRPLPGGGWVTTVDDVTERRRIEERVAHLARHDPLTGLPNRAEIDRAIREVVQSGTAVPSCTLFYIDLDHFKPVNDTFGHHAGDRVLRVVADRIQGVIRRRDVAARLGGDEFAVVAHDCPTASGAMAFARRIIWEIGQPIEIDGGTVSVGASIGIAFVPADGVDADTLLRHADLALYRAKAEGRDGCHVYDPALEAAATDRRDLERELREALAGDGFELHYQPVVDAAHDRQTGFEALLRWTSPTRGPVSPADFIPFAEGIGLMPAIDDWVLRRACAAATAWPPGIVVSVNLSPTGFRRPDLVGRVAAVLSETGLPPDRLELEITETAAIGNLSTATGILEGIRALGVHIALDDFGTGYSSLSLLSTLPFSRIKIDRSFVRDMGTRPQAAAVVTAVCGLCRSLGVRATAEGVETAEQAERLQAEGCSDLQGYLIGRPMPLRAVPGWIGAFGSGHAEDADASSSGPLRGVLCPSP